VVVLVAVALVVAVVKPWDWNASAPPAPGRGGTALPTASPMISSTPGAGDWTEIGARVACLSGSNWLAVVDQVDGPTVSRSWTRIDLAPVTGPTDPAITRTVVYADAVPRLGFCAPTTDPRGPGTGGGVSFRVSAWRLGPGDPSPGPSGITEIAPAVIAIGTAEDRGVLYGPPGRRLSHRDVSGRASSWRVGTYVFRVQLGGGRASAPVEAWFAVELHGTRPGATGSPAPAAPGGSAPSAAP
jgi:hypothetical protein